MAGCEEQASKLSERASWLPGRCSVWHDTLLVCAVLTGGKQKVVALATSI